MDSQWEDMSRNAFSNSALNKFLKKSDIEYVEVIDVDGGGCVALTALGREFVKKCVEKIFREIRV